MRADRSVAWSSTVVVACILAAIALPTAWACVLGQGVCGDGICQDPENEVLYPEDCSPCLAPPGSPSDQHETIIEAFEVLGPTGNRIFGLVRRPDPALYSELFPAVVLVPGGTGAGRKDAEGSEAEALSAAGMVVVAFNAEGRGSPGVAGDIRSEGVEDYNGFRHQDGLAKIIEFALSLDYVDPENVGVYSRSFGITMSAGCLGRYPELPIKYLVDGEGPSCSFVTTQGPRYLAGEEPPGKDGAQMAGHPATWLDSSPWNTAWWSEREAVNFIGSFRGEYLRLQAVWDHAQPPETEADIAAYHHPDGWPGGGPAWWQNKHTTDMVNAAVAGGVPWVRVNFPEQGNAVNARFDADNPPVYIPGTLSNLDVQWRVCAVLEMAGRP